MSVVKADETKKTVGVSPKVAWPSVVLFCVGAVLVALHFALLDSSNTLFDIGLAAIGASGVTGAVGFSAPAALQASKPDPPDIP